MRGDRAAPRDEVDEAAAGEVSGGFSRPGKGEASVRNYREGLDGTQLDAHLSKHTSPEYLVFFCIAHIFTKMGATEPYHSLQDKV